MKILIVRHAEPDYEIDSLTEKGRKEAKLLASRLNKEKIDYVYSSPFGRALATCYQYLEVSHKDYVICDWLQEFNYPVINEDTGIANKTAWDFQVEYFTSYIDNYDYSKFKEISFFKNSPAGGAYEYVINKLDELLKEHGYERNGLYYKVNKENHDTLVLFCHLGIECAILSHLINLPFMALAQHFAPPTSSVTTIYTEERKKGVAQFRVQSFGDVSHLYKDDEPISFAARFRECGSDNTRS